MEVKTLEEVKAKLRELVPDFVCRVAPIYFTLAWEWSFGRGGYSRIPVPTEIKAALYTLIDTLSEEVTVNGWRGLEVFWTPPTKQDRGDYGLRFVVEERGSL